MKAVKEGIISDISKMRSKIEQRHVAEHGERRSEKRPAHVDSIEDHSFLHWLTSMFFGRN